jgi:hypothetical protein
LSYAKNLDLGPESPYNRAYGKLARLGSPEGAERAEVGLLPRVDPHVQVQLLLADELLVAVLAEEGELALVPLLTRVQLLLIPEAFATDRTAELHFTGVNRLMISQRCNVTRYIITIGPSAGKVAPPVHFRLPGGHLQSGLLPESGQSGPHLLRQLVQLLLLPAAEAAAVALLEMLEHVLAEADAKVLGALLERTGKGRLTIITDRTGTVLLSCDHFLTLTFPTRPS